MEVNDIFTIMGIVIAASFLGATFFRKTRIPNPILLIGIGIGLGQWQAGFDREVMQGVAPIFGSLALMLILLEAGLDLRLSHFLHNIQKSVLFGSAAFIGGAIGCFLVLHHLAGMSQIQAMLLSSVSVGASPTILVPVLKGMGLEESNKAFFDLECTITEVLGLILTVILIPFLVPAIEGHAIDVFHLIGQSGKKIFFIILIALTVPSILGLIWSRILSGVGDKPLWPVLTIGVTLLLFGLSESHGGKGAVNVLVFGLVLGNAKHIYKYLRLFLVKSFVNPKWESRALDLLVGHKYADLHNVSRELSFFVRTFFFVYLGVMVDFSKFTWKSLGVVAIITFIPMLVRVVLGFASRKAIPAIQGNLDFTAFMTPKGLANAVAAFSVIGAVDALGLSAEQRELWQELLVTPVFGVILLSNIMMTGYLILRKEADLIPSGLDDI